MKSNNNSVLNIASWDESDKVYFINDEIGDKYINIVRSPNFSILGLWLSLFGNDIMIKPRANNIYYADCGIHHRADDLPVLIDEDKNLFCCYGCGRGGSFVTLVEECINFEIDPSLDFEEYYQYEYETIINIFSAFIEKDLSKLTKKELKYYKEIFQNYNLELIDYYHKLSQDKTDKINNRIMNYYNTHEHIENIESKMAKRLCYPKSYIKSYLKNYTENK